MSNLLTDATIRTNIENVTGELDDFWLEMAWEELINSLGYEPSSSEVTEKYNGTNSIYLYLNKRPVTEISSVLINDTELDSDNYEIYEGIAIENDTAFIKGQTFLGNTLNVNKSLRRIEVTYTAGYTADNFPYALQLAVISLIQNAQAMTENADNLSSYKIGDIAYSFKTYAETNTCFNSILDKYRSI